MLLNKYKGIIPAFYACYDDAGEISPERIIKLSDSSYMKKESRVSMWGEVRESVFIKILRKERQHSSMLRKACKGNLTLIAHVGAPSTKESVELAKYAEELGYDALSAIPPIYFQLPESAIEKYWMEIMDSTDLPFIIYNIPQTTGYNLSVSY